MRVTTYGILRGGGGKVEKGVGGSLGYASLGA